MASLDQVLGTLRLRGWPSYSFNTPLLIVELASWSHNSSARVKGDSVTLRQEAGIRTASIPASSVGWSTGLSTEKKWVEEMNLLQHAYVHIHHMHT